MRRCGLALLLLAGVPCVAQCTLSPEDSARLQGLSSAAEVSAQSRNLGQGIFYVDHRCFAEARKAFATALEGERKRLRVAASGFLQFIDALEMIDRRELKPARDKLIQILKEQMSTPLLERAPYVLADVLVQAPDPEASRFLQEELQKASQDSWMARAFLANRMLAEGRGAEAIAQIEKELAQELETVRRIELQIQLAHLLFRQGRLAEAQLLLARLDPEVGEMVLDSGLRINFLILAVQVWAERVRKGGDPTAPRKLAAYSEALNQLPSTIKPRGFVP